MEYSTPRFEIMTSIRSDAILKDAALNSKSPKTSQPSQFYMLSYHYDRMLAAATSFGWSQAVKNFKNNNGIVQVEAAMEKHLQDTYGAADYPSPLKVKSYPPTPPLFFPSSQLTISPKIRILLPHDGNLQISSTRTPPTSPANLFPHHLSHQLCTDNPPKWHIYLSPKPIQPSLYTTHKTTHRAIYDHVRAITLPPTDPPNSNSLSFEVLLSNTDHMIMEGSITTPYFYRREKWVTPPAAHGGNLGTTRRWALERGLCVEEPVPVDSLAPRERIWLSNGVRGWGWGYLEVSGS